MVESVFLVVLLFWLVLHLVDTMVDLGDLDKEHFVYSGHEKDFFCKILGEHFASILILLLYEQMLKGKH